MKPIEKDELYEHFSQFLKGKGIEMKDGNYTQIVQKGCSIMADAVNLTQQGVERAKTQLDKRLEQIRQVIHEKTAPKPPNTRSAESRPAQKTKVAANAATKTPRQRMKARRASRRSPGS